MSKRLISVLAAIPLVVFVLTAAFTPGNAPTDSRAPTWRDRNLVKAALGDRELEKMDEVMARLNWFYGQRMAPGNRIPELARAAAVRHARLLPAVSGDGEALSGPAKEAGAASAWQSLGPQPIVQVPEYSDPSNGGTYGAGFNLGSGRVTTLAVHPRNPNIAYMGAADGGVWKTTDGGATWSPIGDGVFETLSIGAIALQRRNPAVVFVGTGEANTSSDAYWGGGIYKSSDGGATFQKVGGGQFDRATVFTIATFPRSTRMVFAATNRGLFRSEDGGTNWSLVLAPGGDADRLGNFITDVVTLSRSSAKHLLAAVGWRAGDPNNGLWESTDSGDTWTNITAAASAAGFTQQPRIGRVSLASLRGHAGLLYAVVQDAVLLNTTGGVPTALDGVYKSETGPAGPWVKVATSAQFAADPNSAMSPAKIGPGYQPGIQSWYNQYVRIDPADPNHVIVGLEEIYDTDDGGLTWHTIGRYWNFCISDSEPNCGLDPEEHPTTHPDQHAAAFGIDRANGQPILYVGSDGGVWSQSNPPPAFNNDDWSNLNQNIDTAQFYFTEGSSGPNSVIYGGTQDNGSLKLDGGQWVMAFGGDGGDVAVEPGNPNNTYEEYVYLSMSKSNDGGHSWRSIDTPDSGSSATARFIAPFDLDPLNDQHIVALGRHVWESFEGIKTRSSDWDDHCDSTGLTECDNGAGHVGTALAVRGDVIYSGWCGPCNPAPDPTDPSGTGFSRGLATNSGGIWRQRLANGLPNRYITSVTIDPANRQHIFVTLSGFSRRWVPYAGTGHVFESFDSGKNFTDISGNLPDGPANDTVLHNGRLIVGTDVGVFELTSPSTDTWSRLGTGMPAVSTLDLSVIPGTSTLLAGTHGRGAMALNLGA